MALGSALGAGPERHHQQENAVNVEFVLFLS